MNHKLSLKTADFYGRLLACVPEYARFNFDDVFEKFLDAYDAENFTANVKVSEDEDDAEEMMQLIKDAIEHANFNGDVEKFARANGLKFDKQRENSRLSELCKRFIDNENVKFFSASKRDDGSIEIRFEEIREV